MNSNFPFRGVSVSDLASQAITRSVTKFTGTWRTVEMQPDVFVPQTFTVGVVVVSSTGEMAVKILEDHSKFDCVYRSRFDERSRSALLDTAREVLTDAAKNRRDVSLIDLLTANLRLSEPRFTSGDTVHLTAARLFEEVVVMAAEAKVARSEGVSTRDARKIVNDQLKRIAKADYDRIVVPDGSPIYLNDKGKAHKLDINLRPAKACGAVVSTIFHNEQSVEVNMLRPSSDIAAYTKEFKLAKPALFLLLPSSNQLDSKTRKKVEDVVSAQEWKLEREGFRVVSQSSEERLAEEIYDWAKQSF